MRELFLKLFGEKPANEFNGISMFSWTHILYLVLIIGVIVLLTFLFRKKDLSFRVYTLYYFILCTLCAKYNYKKHLSGNTNDKCYRNMVFLKKKKYTINTF